MIFNRQAYLTFLHDLSGSHELGLIPLLIFEIIPSTNQKLWELIDRGEQLPLVAIALQQTAGKGQWGRSWQSSLGGLYLSLAINLDMPSSHYPHLTIATAWGIATALRNYDLPVWLKWPNDLLLQKRKLVVWLVLALIGLIPSLKWELICNLIIKDKHK
jgi:BirA family biotin operon repressor/biotin-[acetyl-CoA-carboxylase] ligase